MKITKQNIYHGSNPVVPQKKGISTKDLIIMVIITSFALYELLTIALTQNAIVYASPNEEHVNSLLNEQVIEDYSTSLPDYTLEFGTLLKSQLNSTPWMIYDVDRLADAVAKYETSYCTNKNSPTANKRNNCWGIMTWKRGFRELRTYASVQEGKEDFKRLWVKGYGRFPTKKDAKRYSGGDKAGIWLRQVTKNYHE